MGKLFDSDDTSSSEYMEIQDVLDTYAFDEKTHLFDTAAIMERVINSLKSNRLINRKVAGTVPVLILYGFFAISFGKKVIFFRVFL